MAGNVFGLNEVYDLQKDNATDLDLNIPGLEVGYFVSGQSGYPSPTHTNMFRFEFSTDTHSNPSNNISQGRYYIYGLSGPNAGYACGGYTSGSGGSVCTVDRVDFSNETTLTSVGTPTQRAAGGGMGNDLYGYLCQGVEGPAPPYAAGSRFDRLDFNTETWNLPGNNASVAVIRRATLTNSSYSYVCGGTPGPADVVDRFDFSNDSVSQPFTLPIGKESAHGVASPDYGFIVAGIAPTPPYGSTVERLEFATETMSSPGNNMPVIRGFGAQIYNKDHAIIGLGLPPTGDPWATCTVDRLDFTTETASTLTPTNGRRAGPAGIQAIRPQVFKYVPGNSLWKESPNYGYTGGGQNPPIASEEPTCTIDRMDFSSETTSIAGSRLHFQRRAMATITNSNFGYFAMGYSPPTAYSCKIDRLDYSTEIVSAPTSQSPFNKFAPTGLSAQEYGYLAGGDNPKVSTIARMDWANETMSTPTTLQEEKLLAIGFSTKNTGFIVGGQNPTAFYISTIEHLDFSTETTSYSPSRINGARRYFAGTQTESFGYFSAGQGSVTTFSNIGRIEFSNDTTSLLSAELPTPTEAHTGYSNFSHGFYSGGQQPSVPTSSCCTINRLDFTTETVSSPSSQLTQARKQLAGMSGGIATRRVGKATYGYFAGGRTPAVSSKVDRLDFTTETVAVPGKDLTQPRGYSIGTFSSNYGYFAAGWLPGNVCTVDRLDFSNETVAANPGGQTTIARRGAISVRNTNYSYIAGGTPPALSIDCVIERLDFSTETFSENTSALTQARRSMAGSSTPNYGYFAGGEGPTVVCTINRIEFSTETVSANASQLTQDRGYLSIGNCGNNLYGYFGGGYAPGSVCTIDRLDFSTETVTAPGTYQLTQARHELSAASSSAYGYFGGGNAPGSSSIIDRLDFASETVSLPSQSLTQTKFVSAAVSNG